MFGIFCSNEKRNNRLKICNECEHKTNKWLMIFNEESCSICKCSIPKKSRLTKAKCPLNKW